MLSLDFQISNQETRGEVLHSPEYGHQGVCPGNGWGCRPLGHGSGPKNVRQSRILLQDEQAVHLALEKGLTVGGTFLAVDPLETTSQKMILSNVQPYIPAELLLPNLYLH